MAVKPGYYEDVAVCDAALLFDDVSRVAFEKIAQRPEAIGRRRKSINRETSSLALPPSPQQKQPRHALGPKSARQSLGTPLSGAFTSTCNVRRPEAPSKAAPEIVTSPDPERAGLLLFKRRRQRDDLPEPA
ncbi:hypothetical protein MRX96_055542 [Rhipicephalus microplus]